MLMKHPHVKAEPVKVPQAAFDKVWSKKGWVEVKDPDAPTAADASKADKADTPTSGKG